MNSLLKNPLSDLDYSFINYVNNKKIMLSKHIDGNGLPDYAYKMDYEHRKHLDSIPGLFNFAKKLCATQVPQALQKYSMVGVAVGPNQYPEIYKMVRECAGILGIGIPNVLIVPDISGEEFNACTYAMDDVEPVILVTGLMVQRMTADELKAIIGHECGHIHNRHGIYGILENIVSVIGSVGILSLPGFRQFASLLTASTQIAISMWSRAAEVTADRAALICSGSVDVTKNALSKLMYNGANMSKTIESDLNINALRKQMEMALNNPNRINELLRSHPITIKRVFAVMDFSECDKFYEWRPDLKLPGQKLYTKETIDKKCKKYIDVVTSKGGER